MKKVVYFAKGIHCASCELIIEKEMLDLKGVKAVDVSSKDNSVTISYTAPKPELSTLNKLFKSKNYKFFERKKDKAHPFVHYDKDNGIVFDTNILKKITTFTLIITFSILLIFAFTKLKIGSFLSIDVNSSLFTIFAFGLLAGCSTCAALTGGLVLSMSKQWTLNFSKSKNRTATPHILFNTGRIISFTILGATLGLIGTQLQFSATIGALLVIFVSLFMFLLALQMLGIKSLGNFQIKTPRFLLDKVTDEENFKKKYMPFIIGALTFLLPCGFTLSAQAVALATGSVIQGALVMLAFALGTLPMLLVIGISSTQFINHKHYSNTFLKIAGVLVIIFALFNINSQLNVLGLPSLNDLTTTTPGADTDDLPVIVDGKQEVYMTASSRGYSPSYIKVKVGIPVKWIIKNAGVSGCTNAIIATDLFEGQISIDKEEVIKEFTPQKTGKYKFSCWMGMVSGTIEVIDEDGNQGAQEVINSTSETSDTCSPSCDGTCGGSCGDPNCTAD